MSGKIFSDPEEHPSYAQLGFSRITSNRRVPLYGTSNECREIIRMTIKRSEIHRNLYVMFFAKSPDRVRYVPRNLLRL
jgi:hypothetical protein